MLFHVLAGLRELLRRVEATLPHGRRFLTQQLDSVLALAERTAIVVSLSPALPPLPALPQDDQGQGGVNETNLLPSNFGRLFILLPQVLVIFTTVVMVVIGLIISVPVYPMQVLWRGTNFRWSGRIFIPTPLAIVLWLRNRRLLLRYDALEDARQSPTRGQVLMLADIGVGPAENNSEDASIRSKLIESGSQDASVLQDVQGADHLSQGPLSGSDSPLPAASPDSGSYQADSQSPLRFSDSPLASRAPTPGVLPSYHISSCSSSSVYIASSASGSCSRSLSPQSSDSEAAPDLPPRALPRSPLASRSPLTTSASPSGMAAPRSSPRPPSRIPIPISRLHSPSAREHGVQRAKPVSSDRGQTSPGSSPSHTWASDFPGRGFTAAGADSSRVHGAAVSPDQELLGKTSESCISPGRDVVSVGLEASCSVSGNPSPSRSNPSPGCGNPSPGCGNPSPGCGNPSPGCGNPSPSRSNPSPGCGNPSPSRSNPSPGYGNPSPNKRNPSPGYGNPSPSKRNPSPGYGNPSPSKRNPSPGYGNPSPSKRNPSPGYGNPSSKRNPSPGYGNHSPRRSNSSPGMDNPSPGRGNPSPGYGNPSPRRSNSSPSKFNHSPSRGNSSPGMGYPSPSKINTSPSHASESPVKISPSKRQSPGQPRTSLQLHPSPGTAPHSPRSIPSIPVASEPPPQTDSLPDLESSPTPGSSDIANRSRSSVPFVNSHVRALSFSNLGPEVPIVLLEAPSSTDKSRSPSPGPSVIASATQSLYTLPPQRSQIPPDDLSSDEAPSRSEQLVTQESTSLARQPSQTSGSLASPESRSPVRETHALTSGHRATPESSLATNAQRPRPTPKRQLFPTTESTTSSPPSPASGSVGSRGSASPARETHTQEGERLTKSYSSPDHETLSPKTAQPVSRGSKSPAQKSPSATSGRLGPQEQTSFSSDSPSRKRTPSRPRRSPGSGSPGSGSPSQAHIFQIPPQESPSPSRQTNVPPRGEISPISGPPVPQSTSPGDPLTPKSVKILSSCASGSRHRDHSRSPPMKRLYSERDLPSQSSPPAQPCSTNSLSPAKNSVQSARTENFPNSSHETQESHPSPTSSKSMQRSLSSSSASSVIRSLSQQSNHPFSPTLPCESPGLPVGAATVPPSHMVRPQYQSPVRVTESCFHRVSKGSLTSPIFYPPDPSVPQSSTSSPIASTSNASPDSTANLQRFALTRFSSSPFSPSAHMGSPSTSNMSPFSPSTSSQSAPPGPIASASRGRRPVRFSGLSRWPPMAELAAAAAATASSGYETVETSEDTSTWESSSHGSYGEDCSSAADTSDPDSLEAETRNAGRTPGVRRQLPVSEFALIHAENGSPSQPTDQRTGGEVDGEMPSTSSGPAARRPPSPSMLAAYAAIGQGPSPNHPSGFAPLACLAVPLGDAADSDEFPSVPRPLFQEHEQPDESSAGTADSSGTAGDSRDDRPSKEPTTTNSGSPVPKHPMPADSTDEVSRIPSKNGSSEPADQPTGGEADAGIPSTSSSSTNRVPPSPSILAAYAAIGQGPSPNHPSGFAPLACLAVPLGDAADPDKFSSLARPLFQENEQPAESSGDTADSSSTAGGSKDDRRSKEPAATNGRSPGPKQPVPADSTLAIPADSPQIDKPVNEAEILAAMEEDSLSVGGGLSDRNEAGPSHTVVGPADLHSAEQYGTAIGLTNVVAPSTASGSAVPSSSSGGPTSGLGQGPSSGDGGTSSKERHPSVVRVVLSLKDLANAIVKSSSTASTHSQTPLAAQTAEEKRDAVSSTPSDLPSLSPGHSPLTVAQLADEIDVVSSTPSDLPSLSSGPSPLPTVQPAEEMDVVSSTPSDPPSLSPASPCLNLAVNLPLLADALGTDADRSSSESKNSQEMKKACEGSDDMSSEFMEKPERVKFHRSVSKDAESSSSRPLSSHSSLELTEFIDISDDDSPSHTLQQLEDLEKTLEHSSSPGSGDQSSNGTHWAMVPAADETTSNISRDDGKCTNNKLPKE